MIDKFKLRNGVTVVTERMESVRSVAVGVWAGAGARSENRDYSGVSHFIEHMLFKGTRRRTARQIAEEIDFVGGHINAFTAKDCTCFYTNTLDSHLEIAVDILSDIILHSKIAKTDVDLERNVILEEINMYEDSPDELVHDLLTEGVWNASQLGNPILGTRETLARIGKSEMKEYIAAKYTPENIVISVSGRFDGGALRAALEKGFGGLGKGRNKRAAGGGGPDAAGSGITTGSGEPDAAGSDITIGSGEPDVADNGFITGRVADRSAGAGAVKQVSGVAEDTVSYIPGAYLREKDTEQIHMCVGFESAEFGDDDLYPLNLVNFLLGGGMSSVLFQKIREELGLVYTIYSYISAYKSAGLFAIYAGTQLEQAARVLYMILDEIKAFASSGLTPELLTRAKEQFKGSYFMGLDSPNARMSAMGKSQLLLGYMKTPEETVGKIEAVSVEDAYRVIKNVFEPRNLAISAVGRVGGGFDDTVRLAFERGF